MIVVLHLRAIIAALGESMTTLEASLRQTHSNVMSRALAAETRLREALGDRITKWKLA